MYSLRIVILGVLSFIALNSCSGIYNPKLAKQCSQGLEIANRELNAAKTQGFGGTVAWTKAATLLAAAEIQQQFDKFPNCINKVQRARRYIKRSQQK